MNNKNWVVNILTRAGITVNGTNPWDIQVHNEKFYSRARKIKRLAGLRRVVHGRLVGLRRPSGVLFPPV
jgi:hypothetical protein